MTVNAVQSNKEFTMKLYKAFSKSDANSGNLIFSPFSLHAALAMLCAGASGDTEQEILRGLQFSPKSNICKIARSFQSGLEDLPLSTGSGGTSLISGKENNPAGIENDKDNDDQDEGLVLRCANKLYATDGFQLNPTFASELKQQFYGGVEQINFSKKSATNAVKTINAWISAVTKEEMGRVIRKDDVHQRTRLILVSCLYFRGYWKYEFKTGLTTYEDFHMSAKTTVEVPMMQKTFSFPYCKLPKLNADAVALPYAYQDGRFRMIIIRPKKIEGLPKIQENIDFILNPVKGKLTLSQRFQREDSKKRKILLKLPQFRVESNIDNHLMEILRKDLGMQNMFSENEADFDEMVHPAFKDDVPLVLSKVAQKVFMQVNERGTEAATTASKTYVIPRPCRATAAKKPIKFEVDRPFFFMITDSKNNDLVLFCGHVTDPTEDY